MHPIPRGPHRAGDKTGPETYDKSADKGDYEHFSPLSIVFWLVSPTFPAKSPRWPPAGVVGVDALIKHLGDRDAE